MINLTIEAGGFIQSTDAGQHWEAPKTQDTPIDIHVLKSHLEYPNKMYGVLGDAFLNGGRDTFIESDDYGKTWTTFIFFPIFFYFDKKQESKWTEATKGLPSPDGTLVSAVTERDGIFYLANNKGVYYSDDGGIHWVAFDIAWLDSLTSQHAHQFITLN